ncbi:HpcH/HpaI aldolase family protein [Micromonospora echinofusca]|uniref:HpcH/HpaI aldolase/citrate lyase domain-containing protein n=1 Tax=Micromonospora echinofusca TaxID=47858 RepID=A0ABS3VUY8_MICEH|nr:aldolase/citrate lyase family protein [Micromonospora echinofusca]MBO4208321.1 hypothetical protein [Micromonospora echinofusca]
MNPRQRLRSALTGTGRLVGTFLKLPVLDSVDIAWQAGLDFVVVDGEHSPLAEEAITPLVRHAATLGLPALVRLPEVDTGRINRLLEAGAAGVQLSTVRSRAEVDALVAATRYPPHGQRSVSLAHPAARFGAVPLPEYLADAHRYPPVLVVQIETADTVDPLPSLLTGVDVAFVGTTDLAVSLGGGPDVLAARIATIAAAAHAGQVVFGGWVAAPDQAERAGLGAARYLMVGSDLQLLGTALRDLARSARAEPGTHL